MAYPYQLPDLIAAELTAANLGWPVRHIADLGNAPEELQIAPAILVVPYQLNVQDITSVRESVLVAAVTRVANQRSGQAGRQQAGEILASVVATLREWQPTTGHTPLTQETPPQPQFIDGVGVFVLQFSAEYELQ
jgi:hypothetical protein